MGLMFFDAPFVKMSLLRICQDTLHQEVPGTTNPLISFNLV
jgi:hypothetical protein